MATTEEYDYLVLGDEPAGLWLLSELDKIYRNHGATCRGGWITQNPRPNPVPVSLFWAKEFGLPVTGNFALDMVTPEQILTWDASSISARFDSLPKELFETLNGHSVGQASAALARHPSLLNFAKGYWKLFGRSPSLSPEHLLLNACLGSRLGWWDPLSTLSGNNAAIDVSSRRKSVHRLFFSRKGMISVQLADETTLLSRCLILNTSLYDLEQLLIPIPHLAETLEWDIQQQSKLALYPFQLEADPLCISQATPPLAVYFSQSLAPEVNTDIWPLHCTRKENRTELQIWAQWSRALCLDGILERFREGLRHMERLFPFLDTHTLSYSVPLDASQCASDEIRSRCLSELERAGVEKYELTRIHTHTRRPNVHFISPSLHCELPYPFGTLKGARALCQELAQQKKWPRQSGKVSLDFPDKPGKSSEASPEVSGDI